jgi:hypothetical protein
MVLLEISSITANLAERPFTHTQNTSKQASMHRSTILALALAAANTSALLAKRDSSTVTATATATGETDVVTVTSLLTGPSATASPRPSHSDSDDSDSDSYEDYGSSLCYPHNATNSPDLSAPCNLIAAIEAQCSYGPRALEFLSLPSDSDAYPDFNDPKWQLQSPANERVCICESQIIDATLGCVACLKAHEGGVFFSQGEHFAETLPGIMARYCNASYVPTESFIEFMADAQEPEDGPGDFGGGQDGAESGDGASSFSDPIGTATDVSLYYTMSVTRSDAYDLAVPTGSNGNVTFTSTRTSDGQIVPTAVDAKESSVSGGSGASGSGGEDAASATSSADSGAATVYAGAAGLFAVVALAAVGL